MIANETQDLNPPFLFLGLVLAHVGRKKRMVLVLTFDVAVRLVIPVLRTPLVDLDSLLEECADVESS